MDEKYIVLFNAITDAINQLEVLKAKLIASQQKTEELYVAEAK